jgi:hypothetical protein
MSSQDAWQNEIKGLKQPSDARLSSITVEVLLPQQNWQREVVRKNDATPANCTVQIQKTYLRLIDEPTRESYDHTYNPFHDPMVLVHDHHFQKLFEGSRSILVDVQRAESE